MFDKKVNSLFKSEENLFVKEGLKKSFETESGNGALKYSTSGNGFVDDYASLAIYKNPRSYSEIADDMQRLWSLDPTLTVKLALYIRLITRKSIIIAKNKSETLKEVQKGQGLKHEGIMRQIWLAINHPATFRVNLTLFIAAGSWKDIITMLNWDLQYHGWKNRKLDWNFFKQVLQAGLINPDTTNLVRKYLPTIRTNSKCTTLEAQADTIIGRWIARFLFPDTDKEISYKQYRKLKSQGTAHHWQQLISQQLYYAINFDTIAGRALALLVGSKFLQNHNLEDKYTEWILSKPMSKFTGYVFEIFKPLKDRCKDVPKYLKATIDSQFRKLVELGKTDIKSKLLVVRDVSGSMSCMAYGTNMTSNDIAKSMALYFSEFLTGEFAGTYAIFSNTCKLKQWSGNTPSERWINDWSQSFGSTNFQSVIDLFISLKEKGVPESDFPDGLLLISDGEFDAYGTNTSTNFNIAIQRLKEVGFSEEYVSNFKIILWDIPNTFYGSKPKPKFEDFADAPNFFYISGYDPSAISFILGSDKPEVKAPKNAEELFLASMDQELLNRVRIVEDKKKTFKKNK